MKFVIRSLVILLALYGVLFAVVDAYLAQRGTSLWIGILFAFVMVGLQYLLSPWFIEWILHIDWDDARTDLPAANREFIETLCAARGLKTPRIGIIHSSTPNAFSFGRLRDDARIVVTSGLLDVLTADEANAVLAHELGHIEHYDFVVITIAALVPLLLYQIYIFSDGISNSRAVAWGAYLCYLVSQFIVLSLNRTREYFADHYACEVTHAPDLLSSALVKIAYGMVRAEGEYREAMQKASGKDKKRFRREHRIGGSLALLGVSNVRSGESLALGSANPAEATAVMRWDLVNPWARLYEMSSTHPLTALRVRALNAQAEEMQQPVHYPLPVDQKIQWAAFPLEVALWIAPWVCAAALILSVWTSAPAFARALVPEGREPLLLIALGISWIARIAFRYQGTFEDAPVGKLLEDVEVSEMRPRAVRLRGEIIGRGVPGAFWSADLVLRDETGMLFVLYRQSIPFARLLFALGEADQYIGKQVEIEGWYRRGLRPYVEMSRLITEASTHKAWSRWVQYGFASVALVVGCLWLRGF